jgi:hypothetical protein
MELSDLEQAIARIEALPDAVAREQARRLVASVLEFHREALQRLCSQVPSEVLHQLGQDDLISSLLTLHDLHPDPLPVRLERALERVRPRLPGPIQLLECGSEVVLSLQLEGCASTQAQARALVENALLELAPDAPPLRYQEPLVQLQMRLR